MHFSSVTHLATFIITRDIQVFFPGRLKIVVVKPLFNKGDKTSMTNYRLISLLNVFFKVSETAMHSRLSCHLHNNILAT